MKPVPNESLKSIVLRKIAFGYLPHPPSPPQLAYFFLLKISMFGNDLGETHDIKKKKKMKIAYKL